MVPFQNWIECQLDSESVSESVWNLGMVCVLTIRFIGIEFDRIGSDMVGID